MDLLCDNNIILDYLLRREPFDEDAARVFAAAAFGDVRLHITTAMLTDLFYILKKHRGIEGAHDSLEALSGIVEICSTPSDAAHEAIAKRWQDFEDCLISCCAERLNMSYIVTRNIQDFTESAVPAVPPQEILAMLKKAGCNYDEVLFD